MRGEKWGWTKTIAAQCALCGGKMRFEQGDIIFGEKWYHRNCAEQVKIETKARSRFSD